MAATPTSPPGRRRPGGSRLRTLDGRTLAISALVALVAALAAGILVSVLHDSGSSGATETGTMPITPAPKVDAAAALGTRLHTFDGRATTLAAHVTTGKPAVINFFSTTCTPCITEMPAFERVHRSRSDVSFIGIDVQDQVAAGRKLIERTGISYPALRDPPGDVLTKVGGVGLPTTVVIDANGRVVATHTGALTEKALNSLLRDKLR